ncbi:putative oxidoreductase [Atractiella rhizophila]|nr:putative oxidoreductase [Atractiella rhizophila]
MSIQTPITKLFGIKHPIFLAGMNVAAGPDLAAAVTNAGGMGVIGGIGYTPKQLREQIHEIKEGLNDKNAPFGVDLLLPQVGGSARKTNHDYTRGQLPELIDVIIEEKAKLFVCAVGVPPKWAVEKLHKAGIPVMNMIGHPKHVKKCIEAGVDIITAQGGEGGGHTGDVPTALLIPAVVELCKGHKSSLTGQDILVVAAGGIYNGKGLAASLMYGASAVWVGTRFVCAEEAGASPAHQKAVMTAGYEDTIRTIIFTGRPLRVRRTPFIDDWEENRQKDIKELTSKGKLPVGMDSDERPFLMGRVAALINDVKPAKAIVDEMIAEAVAQLKSVQVSSAKL